eukprot:CAMPEP_0201560398 /NCGR_PEP_ID=MMETSP0173_2-20130828/78248_1 /ASSEMBLY_ACC=CAM_ASM_000268 /TAXON_ID=218659 /ORGANISM="Vexillifera sp., Strain DIVA3 564/2" /LENGTH=208 /DNA_ID=CAMNT_0047974845 /DNA_START=365 /DNA_END=994 /DNA_ORIENTATION=+
MTNQELTAGLSHFFPDLSDDDFQCLLARCLADPNCGHKFKFMVQINEKGVAPENLAKVLKTSIVADAQVYDSLFQRYTGDDTFVFSVFCADLFLKEYSKNYAEIVQLECNGRGGFFSWFKPNTELSLKIRALDNSQNHHIWMTADGTLTITTNLGGYSMVFISTIVFSIFAYKLDHHLAALSLTPTNNNNPTTLVLSSSKLSPKKSVL